MKPLVLCALQQVVIPGVRTRVPVYHSHLFACMDEDLLGPTGEMTPREVLNKTLEKIGGALGSSRPFEKNDAQVLLHHPKVGTGEGSYVCLLPIREGVFSSYEQAHSCSQEFAQALKAQTGVEFVLLPDTGAFQEFQNQLFHNSPMGVDHPSLMADFTKLEPALALVRASLHDQKLAGHAAVQDGAPSPRRMRR